MLYKLQWTTHYTVDDTSRGVERMNRMAWESTAARAWLAYLISRELAGELGIVISTRKIGLQYKATVRESNPGYPYVPKGYVLKV